VTRALGIVVTGLAIPASPSPSSADPTFHTVKLASGVTLKYAAQGPESGEAVLMLHGYTDTWFSFSRVLPLTPASLRVIVPDQRGHGESDRPETGYDMEDFATDAIQLMDALKIPRATIVGHSMGSFVARRVAARAPDRVSRLVLIGAGPSEVLVVLKQPVDALSDPVDPAFVREFQVSTVHRGVPDAFMERAIADSGRVPARVWKAVLAGLLNYRPQEADLRCPTLVLGGDRDGVFSRGEQEGIARRIPGATLRVFTDVGHALHWEDPDRFAVEFAAFLQSRRAS
jgi:pimeloyl-ACP methyl ester carboxylesterase